MKEQRRRLVEKDKQIEQYKGVDPFLSQIAEKKQLVSMEVKLKNELDKKQLEIAQIMNQFQQKQRKIIELERKLKEKEIRYEEQFNNEQKQKQELKNIIQTNRDSIIQLRAEIERFQKNDARLSKIQITNIPNFIQIIQDKQSQKKSDKLEQLQFKKMEQISMDDVFKIGKQLKYSLMLKRIPLSSINLYLSRNKEQQQTSIQEMYSILQEYPFKMSNDQQLICLSRYLIEDNSKNNHQFDINQENQDDIIQSIFKNLVENYQVAQLKDEMKQIIKIDKILNQKKDNILVILNNLVQKSNLDGEISEQNLLEAFKQCKINFDKGQKDLIFMLIFRQQESQIEHIQINSLFSVFNSKISNSDLEFLNQSFQLQIECSQQSPILELEEEQSEPSSFECDSENLQTI